MKLLMKILSKRGLTATLFEDAVNQAVKLYARENIGIEQSERIKVCAAISYRKDSSVCDLGSYVNAYPVVLALLGIRVTTVDYYPQASPNSPHYNPNIQKALDIYRSVGIRVIESDLYEVTLPSESFDVITSFETFEHLWHSPKPIMEKAYSSMREGGEFVLSVPNIVSLDKRVKVILGKSPLSSFPFYYENGNPFTRHRREMTMYEVDWMMKHTGLSKLALFTANLHPPLRGNASRLGQLYRIFGDKAPLPASMRGTIFARYEKV